MRRHAFWARKRMALEEVRAEHEYDLPLGRRKISRPALVDVIHVGVAHHQVALPRVKEDLSRCESAFVVLNVDA